MALIFLLLLFACWAEGLGKHCCVHLLCCCWFVFFFHRDLVFPAGNELWIWELWSANWTIMTFPWSSWPYLSDPPFSELLFCLCILSSRLAGCPYIILSLRMPCVKSYFQDSYWSVVPRLLFRCWCPWWQVGSVCFWLLGAATWPLLFHAPFVLIAIREPNSEAVSAIICPDLQRKTASQFFTACDSFPSTFLITFIVLWAIPRKTFSWYFFWSCLIDIFKYPDFSELQESFLHGFHAYLASLLHRRWTITSPKLLSVTLAVCWNQHLGPYSGWLVLYYRRASHTDKPSVIQLCIPLPWSDNQAPPQVTFSGPGSTC